MKFLNKNNNKFFYTEINNQRYIINLTKHNIEDKSEEELVQQLIDGYMNKDKVELNVTNTKVFYSTKSKQYIRNNLHKFISKVS